MKNDLKSSGFNFALWHKVFWIVFYQNFFLFEFESVIKTFKKISFWLTKIFHLLALLNEIIVKVCCLGCTQLEYLPEKDFVGKYMDYPLPSDIIIPVQNHVEHTKFFNAPYQTLMFVQKISLFAKQVHNPPKNIMSTLFWSLLRAWPLLLMALSLAVVSGCIIWLLVSLTVWISIMHSILLSHSFIKSHHCFLLTFFFIRIHGQTRNNFQDKFHMDLLKVYGGHLFPWQQLGKLDGRVFVAKIISKYLKSPSILFLKVTATEHHHPWLHEHLQFCGYLLELPSLICILVQLHPC